MERGALAGCRAYLAAFSIVVVVARVAQYLWQYGGFGFPEIKGQPPGVYVVLLGCIPVLVLWWRVKGARRAQGLLAGVLALLALLWVVVIAVGWSHGDGVTYEVWAAPFILLLTYLKAPTSRDFEWSLVTLAWSLAIAFLVVWLGELVGILPQPPSPAWLVAYERENYWLPLSGWLGPEGRWLGPTGYNAMTGNAAVLVLLVGLGSRIAGRCRWVLVATSILVFLLTSSRGSFIGVLVGVGLIAALSDNILTRRVPRVWIMISGAVVTVGFVAYALVLNPGMTGRTPLWGTLLEVWQANPIWGIGVQGLSTANRGEPYPNGHNIWIDILPKYGVFAFLLLLALVLVAIVSAWLAARRWVALPAALLGAFLVIGIAQSDVEWNTPSWIWLWFFLIAGMGAAAAQTPRDTKSGSPPEVEAVHGS